MLFIPGSIRGDLPTISGDFSHVAWLQINGRNDTTHLNGFLNNFPGLLHLELQDFSMPGLPESITSMPALRQLVVRNCGITLSLADQQVLASLPNVSILDLQDNPLALPPDVHALAQLRELNLANTGIAIPPADLLNHPRLIAVNFYGNRITELPPPLLTLGAELSNGFNFANNPLSAAAREQIKIHYNRTGKDFGVLAEQVDTDRVRALFPEQNVRQATDLLYRLPGTLAEGREQLSRWEGEIVRLLADLAQWANDIPDRSPVTGQRLNINETFTEHTARTAFARQLEQFWRTRHTDHPDRFSAALTFCGDLPTLSADFSHVSILKLTGNVQVTAVDPLLQRFAGLQTLQLNDFDLGQVPSAISRMPQLHTLALNRCGVVLTPEGQSRLASLAQLKILELANNPLGTPLDLTPLPQLYFLDLSDSGAGIRRLSEMLEGQVAALSSGAIAPQAAAALVDTLFDLKLTAEMLAAMRASVAEVTLDDAIGPGRIEVEQKVEQRMKELLDGYRSGIQVQGVAIKKADPPEAVNEGLHVSLQSDTGRSDRFQSDPVASAQARKPRPGCHTHRGTGGRAWRSHGGEPPLDD